MQDRLPYLHGVNGKTPERDLDNVVASGQRGDLHRRLPGLPHHHVMQGDIAEEGTRERPHVDVTVD